MHQSADRLNKASNTEVIQVVRSSSAAGNEICILCGSAFERILGGLTDNRLGSRVNLLLSQLDLKKHFQVTVTGDEVKKGKPDPWVFLRAAQARPRGFEMEATGGGRRIDASCL